jgi:hypothetical protein
MIDAYLQRRYGDSSGDPVVRRSHVELDGSVYCAILSTPQLTQRFLRDLFVLFEPSGITTSPPQYLYLLNSNGIPFTSFNSRPSSSLTFDPSSQRQLDTLTAQCDAMAATIRTLADDQKVLSHNFQSAQQNITRAFADSTAVYAATNLVSTAQSELTSLQQSLTTLQLMYVLAPTPQAQGIILDSVSNLSSRIETATAARDSRAQELHALQTRSLPMLGFNEIPDLTPHSIGHPQLDHDPMPSPPSPSSAHIPPSPSPSHKRPRTSFEDETLEDAQDAGQVATQMIVDSQPMVRRSPFQFLKFAATLVPSSFIHVLILAFVALKTCVFRLRLGWFYGFVL